MHGWMAYAFLASCRNMPRDQGRARAMQCINWVTEGVFAGSVAVLTYLDVGTGVAGISSYLILILAYLSPLCMCESAVERGRVPLHWLSVG